MKFNNKLFNQIVKANFEKCFEKIENGYSKRNYWRVGHTSLTAIECGCERGGVDKLDSYVREHYPTKAKVIEIIKIELKRNIKDIASGDWVPDDDIAKVLAQLLLGE